MVGASPPSLIVAAPAANKCLMAFSNGGPFQKVQRRESAKRGIKSITLIISVNKSSVDCTKDEEGNPREFQLSNFKVRFVSRCFEEKLGYTMARFFRLDFICSEISVQFYKLSDT